MFVKTPALILALLVSCSSQAQIIFSNVPPSATSVTTFGGLSISNDITYGITNQAVKFQALQTSTLYSVDVGLWQSVGGHASVQVSLFSNGGSIPGSLLATTSINTIP